MPYITQEARKLFDKEIDKMVQQVVTSGEMNYIITKLCHEYLNRP